MTLLGSIHLCFAVIALTLGPIIFRRPKGNRSHVLSGRGYFISMVILNVSALPVFEISGQMTLFHFLAGISLLTVTTAWLTAVFRWPQRGWFAVHAHLVCWSYAGLLSAGGTDRQYDAGIQSGSARRLPRNACGIRSADSALGPYCHPQPCCVAAEPRGDLAIRLDGYRKRSFRL